MKKFIWFLVVLPMVAAFTFITVSSLSNKLILSFKATAQDNQQSEKTQPKRSVRRRIHEMPQIVSETPSLQLIHTEVKSLESDDFLSLTFRNDSPKAIVSFTICTRLDEYGRNSISFSAGLDVDPEFVAPYGEKTIEIAAGNIKPNTPITLCAVTFADESQEGIPHILESDKESREEAKRQRRPQ